VAVLSRYYIKVKCPFKFVAVAVAAHYSLHTASVRVYSPARGHGSLCVAERGLSHVLGAPDHSHILKRPWTDEQVVSLQ
jgi:hypothetical protein